IRTRSCPIGSAVVVVNRLPKVVAVAKWLATDSLHARVDALNRKLQCRDILAIDAKFQTEFLYHLLHVRGGVGSDVCVSLVGKACTLGASPRTQSATSGLDISEADQSIEDCVVRRIHREIRRARGSQLEHRRRGEIIGPVAVCMMRTINVAPNQKSQAATN